MSASGEKSNLWKWIGIGLVVILVIIQFIPVNRDNPEVTSEIQAPTDVKQILERSCYDCHSNTTRWPWYSYIAPASWLVSYDVHEAREHMNLTRWDTYSPKDRLEYIEEMWEEVEEGEMPLWYYEIPHPKSRLSDADVQIFNRWVTGIVGNTNVESENSDHEDHEH